VYCRARNDWEKNIATTPIQELEFSEDNKEKEAMEPSGEVKEGEIAAAHLSNEEEVSSAPPTEKNV
jgi:uncharacterized protein YdaT